MRNPSSLPAEPESIARPHVLLVTPDTVFCAQLERTFADLGFSLETAADGAAAKRAAEAMASRGVQTGIVLLDVRVPEVASGRLLAGLQDSGVHRACAIALIAEAVSDEWIARLREGVIDDIVPRSADAMAWQTHLSTMQRGHALYRELEELRESATGALEYDQVTGAYHRETMLAVLFRETDRVQRMQGSLCVILIEIDDLKYWGSSYGPEVTDQLLLGVAKRIGRILRSYDVLGRVARDQFLLALPGCSTINAVMFAERLRIDVFGEVFAVTDGPRNVAQIRLTGSCAVTSSRGRSPVVVLREAEKTLALAKADGPNSIRCSGDTRQDAEPSLDEARQLFPEVELMLR